MDAVRKRLKHKVAKNTVRLWLDAHEPLLHRILGSEERGIFYGKLIEVSGEESNGKTFLALILAKYAQDDGAYVIWVDFENSYDPTWFRKQGLRLKQQFTIIQPYLKANKKIASCEELIIEAIAVLKLITKHYKKVIVVIDSLAAMVTEKEAGSDDDNMNVNLDIARYMSKTLKKWVNYGLVHNAIFVMINQLRLSPIAFGNPEHTTGGKAPGFYSHSRVRLRLGKKAGRIVQGSRIIGIRGTLANFKNKVGGGSVPHQKIAFKFYYDKPPRFLEIKEAKDEETDED
jgi:recombination protein RecA